MSTATAAPTTVRSRGIPEQYKAILQQILVVAVLILLSVFFTIMKPAFADWSNLSSLLLASVVTGVQALGLSFVIATGGIDLTPGLGMAATSVFAGVLIAKSGGFGLPMWVGVLGGLAAGALLGLINGVLVAYIKMQPMIATLGMMSIARGAALTLAGGRTISGYPPGFTWLGNGTIPGTTIPVQIVFMLLLYVIAYYFMRYRRFGRALYSVGGNEEATRLSGINVFKYKTLAYTVSGALAGIASVVLVAKLNSAQSIAGQDYELDAIASAVIGGASLLGGKGSIWGTLMGALIIGVIRNGLNLLNVSSYLQKLIIGFIILIAVLVDAFRNRERS